MSFRVGQRVRCVSSTVPALVTGKIYTISAIVRYRDFIDLVGVAGFMSGTAQWWAWRFEPADATAIDIISCLLP